MGIIFCVIGLVLFFILGLPEWIVKLIALAVTLLGVFAIFNPEKAAKVFEKYKPGKEDTK